MFFYIVLWALAMCLFGAVVSYKFGSLNQDEEEQFALVFFSAIFVVIMVSTFAALWKWFSFGFMAWGPLIILMCQVNIIAFGIGAIFIQLVFYRNTSTEVND